MRHALQPIAEDDKGNKLAGVVFKVYDHAATVAAAAITQDAAGVWAVNEANLPAETSLFASVNSATNTAYSGPMTSVADGSTVVGYLDAGIYTVVGKIGTRFFVIPVFYAGKVYDSAIGTTITAGMTEDQATAAMIAAIEANNAAILALEDSNLTIVPIAGAAPAVGTIPTQISSLPTTDSEADDTAKGIFDDFSIYYAHDGTNWVEVTRMANPSNAADPTTMTFTV